MTDEEKITVARIKKECNKPNELIQKNMFEVAIKPKLYSDNDIKLVLNLIEKQQNEIEVLKDQKEYVINEYGETIEKLSKMIDLMAEQLTSPINGKEWVIRYFKEKAEGIINE